MASSAPSGLRDAQSGGTARERPDDGVVAEDFVHRDRVGVEVEEPTAALHRRAQVPQIFQAKHATDVIPTI